MEGYVAQGWQRQNTVIDVRVVHSRFFLNIGCCFLFVPSCLGFGWRSGRRPRPLSSRACLRGGRCRVVALLRASPRPRAVFVVLGSVSLRSRVLLRWWAASPSPCCPGRHPPAALVAIPSAVNDFQWVINKKNAKCWKKNHLNACISIIFCIFVVGIKEQSPKHIDVTQPGAFPWCSALERE